MKILIMEASQKFSLAAIIHMLDPILIILLLQLDYFLKCLEGQGPQQGAQAVEVAPPARRDCSVTMVSAKTKWTIAAMTPPRRARRITSAKMDSACKKQRRVPSWASPASLNTGDKLVPTAVGVT